MKKAAASVPATSEKQFWTTKDAARYVNVAPSTLYGWINPKRVKKSARFTGPPPPVYRISRLAIRIPIKEFIEWVENFRQE